MNRTMLLTASACIAALVVVALLGCSAPSLQPLYLGESLVRDPGLAGDWETQGSPLTRVEIREGAEGKYLARLTIVQTEATRTELGLEVGLTRIGGEDYVDLYLAADERQSLAGRYGFLALPVHQFMMLKREGDMLQVWPFNADWVRQAGAENGFASEVLPLGDSDVAVITAHAADLRRYLRRHAQDPGALAPPIAFYRVGAATASSVAGARAP